MTTTQTHFAEVLWRCESGDFAAALALLPSPNANLNHTVPLLYLLCWNLVGRRQFSALEGLVSHLEATTGKYAPEQMLVHLWRGYLLERAGEHTRAVSSFWNAMLVSRNHALHHPAVSIQDTLDVGGTLSFDSALALDPAPLPPVTWDLPAGGTAHSGPVLLLAANDVYIDEFLNDTLDSLEDTGDAITRVHIHAIGLELNATALRGMYPGLSIGLSHEPPCPYEKQSERLAYYAAARFLRAAECLDRYQADLLITDIDATFTPALHGLLPVFARADVALFSDPVQFPWLRYMAGVVSVRNTDASRRMLDLYHRSFSDRLPANSSWLIDQAALYTAIHFAGQRHGLTVAGLEQETGLTMTDVLITPTDHHAKTNLRGEA